MLARSAPRLRAVPTLSGADIRCPTPRVGKRADRRWEPCPRLRSAPSPRRCKPGGRHHRCQILVPPPVLYSQIPSQPNIPMASPHSPHPATTPCPHTSVTAHHPIHHHPPPPLSRRVEDCDGRAALAGVRNLGWTIPAQVVQIDLAVSAAEARYSHPTGKVKSSSVSSGVSPHRVPRPPHRHAQPISGSPTRRRRWPRNSYHSPDRART